MATEMILHYATLMAALRPIAARIDNGMRFVAGDATRFTQTIDVHVRNPVLDGCGGTALEFDLTGTEASSIEVVDPYIYASGAGGERGIAVTGGAGLVTMTGGQVHGDFRQGSIVLDRTRGVRVQGTKVHNAGRPVVVRDSGALQLEPQVMNTALRTAGFAVTCERVYRASIRPVVVGRPGGFGGGVSLDAQCNFCGVDGTAVDPGCFAEVTGSRKLWFGGADATRGAAAQAFAASGNVVSGVLG